MNLYKLTNNIGNYWVIAKDPTEAQSKLHQILDDADYGFSNQRKVTIIELVAEAITREVTARAAYDLTNKFLLL